MKRSRLHWLAAFLLCYLFPCFAHHMAVVVNKENNIGTVTSSHLAKIFRGEVKKWPDAKDVVLVLHRDSGGEMLTLEHLTKMPTDELKALIAAHKDSITMGDSDDDILKAVEGTSGAIGLVDVRSINDQVNVLKVDGKLPHEAGYLPH